MWTSFQWSDLIVAPVALFTFIWLKKGEKKEIKMILIKNIYIYTTVQKFGVIQTISCLPWKLTFIYQMNW